MKKTIALAAVLLLLAVALCGCTQTDTQAKTGSGLMAFDTNTNLNNNTNPDKNAQTYNNLDKHIKIKAGDHIVVNYILRVDGNIIESSIQSGNPLPITVGQTSLIKGFTDALYDMEVGETKTVTIPPELGYGDSNSHIYKTFDSNEFADFASIKMGAKITGSPGVVVAVTDKNATIDFNPMAGKTLVFEITIVSIN